MSIEDCVDRVLENHGVEKKGVCILKNCGQDHKNVCALVGSTQKFEH